MILTPPPAASCAQKRATPASPQESPSSPQYARPPPSPVKFRGFDDIDPSKPDIISNPEMKEIGRAPARINPDIMRRINAAGSRIEHAENQIRIIGEYKPPKKSPPYCSVCLIATCIFIIIL